MKFKKGNIPWNRNRKNVQKSWNKGRVGVYSKDSLKKMSESAKKRKPYSQERLKKMSISLLGKRVGSENPNWKGGISQDNIRARQSVVYKSWRTKVFIKDDYTCQKCFQKGIYLVAHHILNFSQYPQLRTNIKNGITLCKECHIGFHKKYGKKNNDAYQVMSYGAVMI